MSSTNISGQVTTFVITLKQKGFSKSLLLPLYDLTSAGSIFKVPMFVGLLNFADRQTDRKNDYSNPPHHLRGGKG